MPSDIFISYRRSDAAGHARLLHKDLAQFFDAERIFFDRESIESGADFPDTLNQGVTEAKVLVAVIAPQWLKVADEHGARRLDDPTDFVRKEIALALAQGKKVIPVLLDDAPMPAAKELPEELAPLVARDALTLRGKNYEYDRQLAELVRLIAATPDVAQPRRLPDAVPDRPFRGSDQVLSPHFCGRDAELAEINSVFGTASDRPRAVALQGIGGCGKTQVALRYSLDHAGEYAGVWWFRTQAPALLDEDFTELLRQCGVPKADEREPAREAVRRWLVRQPRWLLVFDNAEDAQAFRSALPDRGPHHILITSRDPSWRGLAAPVEVKPWDVARALHFLGRRLPAESESSRRVLSEALGGLPLALEQAAAYCDEADVRVMDYMRRLERSGAALLSRGRVSTGYPDSIARTVSVALDRLSPQAAQLMQYLAWFAPEPVPDAVLFGRLALLPEPLRIAAQDEIGVDDLVSELRKLGLAERLMPSTDRDSSAAALRLHRLTRAVVRELHTDAKAVVPIVVALIDAAAPDWREPRGWPQWAALMPHALDPALTHAAAEVAPEPLADLWNRLGLYQLAAGLVAASAETLRRSGELRERTLGEEHPDTLASMNNLASTLSAQGDLPGARALQERVLEARRRVLGEEHPDTLASMNNLALTLSAQGDLPGARALQERVLEACRRVCASFDRPTYAQRSCKRCWNIV
jgi:hypothetical protein